MGTSSSGRDPVTDQTPSNSEAGAAQSSTRAVDTGRTDDDQRLIHYATALADGVTSALPDWVAASVARRLGGSVPEELHAQVAAAGHDAAEDVGRRVRELLMLDIDEQWTNPLTLIRTAISYPTEILQQTDAPFVARDEQSRRFHPDDVYDLTPASFADLGQSVHDLGISWGAAKAHVHLRRRREEEVA